MTHLEVCVSLSQSCFVLHGFMQAFIANSVLAIPPKALQTLKHDHMQACNLLHALLHSGSGQFLTAEETLALLASLVWIDL
ncbi:hypothetical protein BS47DRAFT_1395224 [Hydnum rufescens UP504]|uniref:Uncharacterized protein n=1 Tax=Hydnum rufescens UP504 TaxID=1448309 RepID=A0A9P6ATU3_9AGAM|nr:hypothetical protein BS47DRAFT_1395224 [Hydnum rufescens UP504]